MTLGEFGSQCVLVRVAVTMPTKPFAMSELIARINALLRRPGGVLGIKLEAGNVRLDTVGRELTVAGTPVRLSRRELAILENLRNRL